MGMKRKIVSISLGIIVLAMVIMQFFNPDTNNPAEQADKTLAANIDVPKDVLDVLKTSCFDCHSHQTKWPWYASIAPASFIVHDHVEDGRKHLNFSTWADYDLEKQLHKLEEIEEEVKEGEMPLKGYTIMHSGTSLSDKQKDVLFKWVHHQRQAALLQ